jgi:hypothetical protein
MLDIVSFQYIFEKKNNDILPKPSIFNSLITRLFKHNSTEIKLAKQIFTRNSDISNVHLNNRFKPKNLKQQSDILNKKNYRTNSSNKNKKH